MAQKLETLADFECVWNALEDPNAKPFRYQVKSFGFCSNCDAVVEYEGQYGPEWNWEKCLSCNRSTENRSHNVLILRGVMVPMCFVDEVERLHSREQQRAFFCELFWKKIQEWAQKAEELERQHRAMDTQTTKAMELLNKAKNIKIPA